MNKPIVCTNIVGTHKNNEIMIIKIKVIIVFIGNDMAYMIYHKKSILPTSTCGTLTVTELLFPMSTVALLVVSTDAGLKSSEIKNTQN